MKLILSILLTAILCATASAQTIRTLGYNSTNGVIVAATNVTWSNSFNFTTNTVAATIRANLGFSTNLNTLWTATNASNARSAVGLGATWLTNTNVTNFRTAVGLGETNSVVVSSLQVDSGINVFGVLGIYFDDSDAAAETRTNLSLGLPALTNTSNVTMMRALAGSTNTNQPYSGTISVVGTNNTNTLVFSNGILQSVQ